MFLERFGPAQGVLFQDDVAFGPDGSLYWTDIAVGQVGRLAPDGTVTKQFVAPGVNPITFSADGRLFVGLAFYGDALWELDPQLQEPPQLVLEAPGQLNAFSFGPDGQLYSPSNTRRTLVRIDVDAKTLTPIGALNRAISAVKFDAAQRLWLHAEGELLRVNRETGAIEQTIALGTMHADNFVPAAEDRFFVSGPGGLVEVTMDGTLRQVHPGGMRNPGGLAVVRDGGRRSARRGRPAANVRVRCGHGRAARNASVELHPAAGRQHAVGSHDGVGFTRRRRREHVDLPERRPQRAGIRLGAPKRCCAR